MSTHNICFRGEIKKYQQFLVENRALSEAILLYEFIVCFCIFCQVYE